MRLAVFDTNFPHVYNCKNYKQNFSDLNLTIYRDIVHHDQIQAYFNIKNWCNSPRNKILKGKNITTIDTEKAFHKI